MTKLIFKELTDQIIKPKTFFTFNFMYMYFFLYTKMLAGYYNKNKGRLQKTTTTTTTKKAHERYQGLSKEEKNKNSV